ncbi:marine proteobacterial sortase target protein [Marinobacter sp. F4206]|uniref:marine proteobacterial sortase target protein n=1 Tax=Marinobacter sp. F4206 TaxID=2861777 RepID=UPI001C604676|nr:marine proteobacterial sortase target protein [Marinobacter sp. F4206]MBW4934776.1 marine proteobacterial sortase target protein [Marinobacter sp. F4206]
MMLSTGLLKLTPRLTDRQYHRARRWAEGVSLWLAVLLMLFVHPLYAEASQSESEYAGLLHFVDAAGRWQEPAIVLDSDFDIQVSGLIADSRLSRRFQNTSDDWREGVFVFPLPEKASVYGLTMKVGERTIVGKVQPKAEARKTYENAKAAGRHAANVEQQRPNLFTARVANIPPGETIEVELRYQQPVAYRAGEFELRLPTTLTPRYMPGQSLAESSGQWQGGWAMPSTQVPDADAISPFTVRASDVDAGSHRASVRMTIDAGLPLARVVSPTHRLETRLDGQTVEVQPEHGRLLMNRDFVVRWRPLTGKEPTAAVFHQRWQDEDYLLTMIVPGSDKANRLPRELVFVIDTSGSMAGESIRQARSALQRGLDTLKPEDRFNIIQFNNQTHTLFMQPEPANGNNLARARRYVAGLNAGGGTEMAPALELALDTPGGEGEDAAERVHQVVFITDGAVGNEAALFAQIRQQLGHQRLFTVGIGSAPNLHFMREAARWGRGLYTAIQDPADVGGPLETLFTAMEAPVLTDVQVQWPSQAEKIESFPARPGDLFQGEPLIQVVRGSGPAGVLKVSGKLPGGRTWERSLDLQQAATGTGLSRHWAREKIDSLLDAARLEGTEPDKARVTHLAVEHGLMSPYTSFVAVDDTPGRPVDARQGTEHLPTLLPAGSQAGMLRYPQTATLAPLLTALGLMGLMFAAAMGLLQRRKLV